MMRKKKIATGKHVLRILIALFPAVLVWFAAGRLSGLITIRNTSSDLENLKQILHSDGNLLLQLRDVYQYRDMLYRKILQLILLTVLLAVLVTARYIRNRGIPESLPEHLHRAAGMLRRCGERLRSMIGYMSCLSGSIRYGAVPDVRRRFHVLMDIRLNNADRYLFAAEPSEKRTVLGMTNLSVISCSGSLTKISCGIRMIWTPSELVLISEKQPFSIAGEDRRARTVHIGKGTAVVLYRGSEQFVLSVF